MRELKDLLNQIGDFHFQNGKDTNYTSWAE